MVVVRGMLEKRDWGGGIEVRNMVSGDRSGRRNEVCGCRSLVREEGEGREEGRGVMGGVRGK